MTKRSLIRGLPSLKNEKTASSFQAHFESIRYRNSANKEVFCGLFTRSVNDQWPLQRRLSEFDFLKGLSPRIRDKHIMAYAVECWRGVQQCALEVAYSKRYVCCLTFASDDVDILWPELFFVNTNLETISRLKLAPPKSKFGGYIAKLIRAVRLHEEAMVLEENCNDPDYVKVYVDFRPLPNEVRYTLLEVNKQK